MKRPPIVMTPVVVADDLRNDILDAIMKSASESTYYSNVKINSIVIIVKGEAISHVDKYLEEKFENGFSDVLPEVLFDIQKLMDGIGDIYYSKYGVTATIIKAKQIN